MLAIPSPEHNDAVVYRVVVGSVHVEGAGRRSFGFEQSPLERIYEKQTNKNSLLVHTTTLTDSLKKKTYV